jgi:hypothetical protein
MGCCSVRLPIAIGTATSTSPTSMPISAYIDRRLREDGKQIPQRRVDGDGDLRLAKRTTHSPEVVDADTEPRKTIPPAVESVPAANRSTPSRWRGWSRRRRALVAVATAAILIAAAIGAIVVLRPSSGSGGHPSPGHGACTATGPWRLRVDGTDSSYGCTVTLTDTASGTSFRLAHSIYHVAIYQVRQAGTFRRQSSDVHCLVTPFAIAGNAVLPFLWEDDGDTDLFAAPANGLTVQIMENRGGNCTLRLYDANGQALGRAAWSPGDGAVTLHGSGSPKVYLNDDYCIIRVAAQT